MDDSNLKSRLAKLDSSKLIEIVKNYRQYGYSKEIRAYAIDLLEKQGITIEDLRLTGNLENAKYTYANELYLAFRQNSLLSLIFYCLSIILKAASTFHFISLGSGTLFLFIFLVVLFFFFLIRSFIKQNDFYKLIGSDLGSEGALIYLLFGMPFYMVMYFVFQSQMKEKMSSIE